MTSLFRTLAKKLQKQLREA